MNFVSPKKILIDFHLYLQEMIITTIGEKVQTWKISAQNFNAGTVQNAYPHS